MSTPWNTNPSDFDAPANVSDTMLAFPAMSGVPHLVPDISIIPRYFGGSQEAEKPQDLDVRLYRGLVSEMLFGVVPRDRNALHGFHPHPNGTDPNMAYRHIMALARTYDTKHEHKEAQLAWLLHKWMGTPVFQEDEA